MIFVVTHLATGDRMSKTENHELILQELKDSPFQKVKVAIVDIDGVMRGEIHGQRKVPVSSGWWFWFL